jgi:hypothetical protein
MPERNSFKEMTVSELKVIAGEFAVDLDGKTKKAEILEALQEDGVSFQMYRSLLAPAQDEPLELAELDDTPLDQTGVEAAKPEEDEQTFVVKMTRKNHSYEVRGHRFTRNNPFALVTEEDADFLIEHGGGFRLASPKELKEFYQ